MPSIRLEFDLDSEVHPELHAALSAIASGASRGERLRQLAATGLVWEALRMYGYPASKVAAADLQPGLAARASDLPPGLAARADDARSLPAVDAPMPTATRMAAGRDATDAPRRSADDSVTAVPAASSPVDTRHFPVLVDVVALNSARRPVDLLAAQPPESSAADAIDAIETIDLSDDFAATAPDALAPDDLAAPAETASVQDPAAPLQPLEHSASTRSRLLRMKERGLFKNG